MEECLESDHKSCWVIAHIVILLCLFLFTEIQIFFSQRITVLFWFMRNNPLFDAHLSVLRRDFVRYDT